MPASNPPPRLHLLPAAEAPVAVILRRKPSRLYHVMLWRVDKDTIEHGSWFRGRIYESLCDVSADGRWMTYFARGSNGNVWNAVCRPPLLRAAAYSHDPGLMVSSAWFGDDGRIDAFNWATPPLSDLSPQQRRDLPAIHFARPESLQAAEPLLTRVGFNWKEQVDPTGAHWFCQPTAKHPSIHLFNPRSTRGRGRIEIDTLNLTLDPARDWACYDSRGQLLIARLGRVERWSLRDIKRGEPGFVQDLEGLTPPPRTPKSEPV